MQTTVGIQFMEIKGSKLLVATCVSAVAFPVGCDDVIFVRFCKQKPFATRALPNSKWERVKTGFCVYIWLIDSAIIQAINRSNKAQSKLSFSEKLINLSIYKPKCSQQLHSFTKRRVLLEPFLSAVQAPQGLCDAPTRTATHNE